MKQEHEVTAAQVEQRAAALEGQQAMLAALGTRMERMREELRVQEEALSDQRAMQEASEIDLTRRQEEIRDFTRPWRTIWNCTMRSGDAFTKAGRLWTPPSRSCGRRRRLSKAAKPN